MPIQCQCLITCIRFLIKTHWPSRIDRSSILRISCRILMLVKSVKLIFYLKCAGDIIPVCRLLSNWLSSLYPDPWLLLTPYTAAVHFSYFSQRRSIQSPGHGILPWYSANHGLHLETNLFIKQTRLSIIEISSKVKVKDKDRCWLKLWGAGRQRRVKSEEETHSEELQYDS